MPVITDHAPAAPLPIELSAVEPRDTEEGSLVLEPLLPIWDMLVKLLALGFVLAE